LTKEWGVTKSARRAKTRPPAEATQN